MKLRRRIGLWLCILSLIHVAWTAWSVSRLRGLPAAGFAFRANLTVGPGTPEDWPGPHRDLRFYDRIVAMDGARVTTPEQVVTRLRAAGPGTPIAWTFRRGDRTFVRRFRVITLTAADLLGFYGVFLAVPVGFVIVALLVLRGGGDHPAALPLCATAAAITLWFASSIEGVALVVHPTTARITAWCALLGYGQLGSALFALSASIPSRRRFAARRPWLVPAVAIAFALFSVVHVVLFAVSTRAWIVWDGFLGVCLVASAVFLAAGVLALAVRAPDPVERLRARIVAAGFVPACFIGPLGWLLPVLGIRQIPSHWLALLTMGVPIGIAAAILRVGLFGLDGRVRRGIVTSLVVTVLLGAFVAGNALAFLVENGVNLSRIDLPLFLVLAALVVPLREALDRLLGRTLFRPPIDPGAVLREADSALASALDGQRITAILRDTLDRALAPEWVRVALPGSAPEAIHEATRAPELQLQVPLEGPDGSAPGALSLGPRRSGEPYGPEARKLVEALAAQARTALSNAAAVSAIRELSGTLEARVADRTERLARAREEIARADKLTSLGELVATVAHEIKNPLNFVQANVPLVRESVAEIEAVMKEYYEVLARNAAALGLSFGDEDRDGDHDGPSDAAGGQDEDDDDSPDATLRRLRAALDDIETGATRIRSVVEALRSFARRESLELRAVDPRAALDRAIASLGDGDRRLDPAAIRIAGEAPAVRAAPAELERLFALLLRNALDALDSRPAGADLPAAELRVSLSAAGDWAEILVEDNGPGVPAEHLPHLFEPFFTTREVGRGVGLGLSVCYGIVRRCGGGIDAENRDEGGARFRVRLPLAPPDAPRATPPADAPPPGPAGV